MSFNLAEMEQFLTDALDSALGAEVDSTRHSFKIRCTKEGIYFTPLFPVGFTINAELYSKIFSLLSISSFPFYTVLKNESDLVVVANSGDLQSGRSLFFEWVEGTAEQMVISNLDEFADQQDDLEKNIPLMKGVSFSLDSVSTQVLVGMTGSGKSYSLMYLLQLYSHIPNTDIVVIDPKLDMPSRWARDNGYKYLAPHDGNNQFILDVNRALASYVDLIIERQKLLFENPDAELERLIITIDELQALTLSADKKMRDSIFNSLTVLSIMGRSAKVNLLLVSQRMDATVVPTIIRSQAGLVIAHGSTATGSDSQFMFGDMDMSGVVVPNVRGGAIFKLVDNKNPTQIRPLIMPRWS